jgi:hypothetical protein
VYPRPKEKQVPAELPHFPVILCEIALRNIPTDRANTSESKVFCWFGEFMFKKMNLVLATLAAGMAFLFAIVALNPFAAIEGLLIAGNMAVGNFGGGEEEPKK